VPAAHLPGLGSHTQAPDSTNQRQRRLRPGEATCRRPGSANEPRARNAPRQAAAASQLPAVTTLAGSPRTGPWAHKANSSGGGRLSGLALLLALLAVAGLLVATLAAPVVLATGLAAKGTADHFDALPTDLPDPVLGVDSQIFAGDGSLVGVLHGPHNRLPVRLGQISKVMEQAIVDIEDSRFYSHHGVDYKGLARAALKNTAAGGVAQGGSTLTQQYVKNVLLDAASTPDQTRRHGDSQQLRRLGVVQRPQLRQHLLPPPRRAGGG